MQSKQKEMVAMLVRKSRLAKGFTQKELSEITNVSIRSIQRIENGDIIPRSYTLKTIAKALDTPFEVFADPDPSAALTNEVGNKTHHPRRVNRVQRIVLSIGLCLVILLLAFAYIFQSVSFPETTFELFSYWSGVLIIITGMLFFLWGTKN